MTIKKSKLLGAIGISCGPFVVTVGHSVMSRNEPFSQNLMPFCLLLVSVLLSKFMCQKKYREALLEDLKKRTGSPVNT